VSFFRAKAQRTQRKSDNLPLRSLRLCGKNLLILLWSRVKKDFSQIKTVLGRSLRLRCPACGESTIVTHPFHIRHHCPHCLSLFKREDGFFVGAILANVVTTELVILVVCFFFLLIVGTSYESVLALLFVMALVFPVAFYHHSWSLWLGFDFIVESLPKHDPTRHGKNVS
jgi:uncharacterized protein (DUF983 family)